MGEQHTADIVHGMSLLEQATHVQLIECVPLLSLLSGLCPAALQPSS